LTQQTGKVYAGEIYVVGLGPGDPLDLPPINLSLLRQGSGVYLRTACHPVVTFLENEGIRFQTFDDIYETSKSFDEVYQRMAARLLELALAENRPVVFAVPGHPLVGETVVRILLEEAPDKNVKLSIWPAPSFLTNIYNLLRIDPMEGLLVVDAFQLCSFARKGEQFTVPPGTGIIISQVYNRVMASEVKLTLMEHLPDTQTVFVVRAAGIPGEEKVKRCPLFELDRQHSFDHLTAVYVPPLPYSGKKAPSKAASYPLDPLVEVMERLLGADGCPWDRQQTHQTLKKYLIEEAYEVIEAIDQEDMHKLCEELGDLLLQVVFHATLAKKRGDFDINEVVARITEKLIRRHPHVFGRTEVQDAREVLVNWEEIKAAEQQQRKSLLEGIPRSLPALQRAEKVQAKASLVGFDWPDVSGALVKMEEELRELKAACKGKALREIRSEIGDLLFAVVNVARLLGVEAEDALRAAVDKFIRRFQKMEERAQARKLKLDQLSLEELDQLWEEAKEEEKIC